MVVVRDEGQTDTLDLVVGDAVDSATTSGFSYAAHGPLVAGDIVGTWLLAQP